MLCEVRRHEYHVANENVLLGGGVLGLLRLLRRDHCVGTKTDVALAKRRQCYPPVVLQPDFDPAPTAVRIHRCGYVSPCRARGCLKRATLIAEKVDVAGRHVRQIELCTRHCQIVIAHERVHGLEICDRRSENQLDSRGGGTDVTEREAIKVFYGLRKAYRAFQPSEEIHALNVLLRTHVLPSALGMPLSSALGTLRAVFDEIDKWESRNP
jgi:hypothetical protein